MIRYTESSQPSLRHGERYEFIFDVDGTLIGDKGTTPELIPLLCRLKAQGHRLGICSSQSAVEVTRSVIDIIGADIGLGNLFNAGFVLEDGHVWVPPDRRPEIAAQVLTSPGALVEMMTFKEAVRATWRPATDPILRDRGWGFVNGISSPPIQLAPETSKVIGSVSLWEKGPEITAPNYQGEYEVVFTWAQVLIQKLGLQYVGLSEAGNGTLRVLQIGIDKGTGLVNAGFDLSRVIFIGNGLNDVSAAQVVRSAGGLVMAVANTVPELKLLAHCVAVQPASDGVIELLQQLI